MRRSLFQRPQEPGPQSHSGASKKPILPRLLVRRVIEAAFDPDNTPGPDLALGFIDSLANHNDGADP